MRKLLKKALARHEKIHEHPWLARFGTSLRHPRLWHLNRRGVAGAVAAGLFCGLIPGPLQMLGAALCALLFRVNLPIALLTTLYTNPFTIVPLYLAAFALGSLALRLAGSPAGTEFALPPDYGADGLFAWLRALADWMLSLGRPLVVGLLLLASALALAGYGLTRLLWRLYLVRQWRQRRSRA